MRHLASGQRGAAALVVTLVLLFVMLLGAGFVNRNLVFEQRIAANQVRSTQAFEAAEAGLDWAIAMLNANQRIGPDCLPSTDPTAPSFRTRTLGRSGIDGRFTPVTWLDHGAATALQPGCVQVDGAWSCACPTSGSPSLAAPSTDAPAPAFTLQFMPIDKAGLVRVRSIGCTGLAGACLPGSTTRADATAQIESTLAIGGGLRTPPAAAITVRGAFDADTAALGLRNADPATGIAVHAGGAVAASHAQFTAPVGATLAASIVDHDASLSGLTPTQFFARHVGLDPRRWSSQAGVVRLPCAGDCTSALTAALAVRPDTPMVWLDGDATLVGPIALGSTTRPVMLVASGALRLDGAVAVHGLVHARSLSWVGTHGGAFLRGAALSETDYRGDGTPEFVYDPAVLALLAREAGSFNRVSGSWRDF